MYNMLLQGCMCMVLHYNIIYTNFVHDDSGNTSIIDFIMEDTILYMLCKVQVFGNL